MSQQVDHIIHRWELHLELEGGEEKVFDLYQSLKQRIKDHLVPQLEEVLDQMVAPQEWVRIPRLVIELGTVSKTDMNTNFEATCLAEIEQQLKALLSPSHKKQDSQEDPILKNPTSPERTQLPVHIQQQFFNFLQTGSLPAWRKSWEAWEEALMEEVLIKNPKGLKNELDQRMPYVPIERKRLLWQFSPTFLQTLWECLYLNSSAKATKPDTGATIQARLEDLWQDPSSSSAMDPFLAKELKTEKKELKEEEGTLTLKSHEEITGMSDDAPVTINTKLPSSEGETHYIQNAGLALLLTCVRPLYKRLGYLDTSHKAFLSSAEQFRAIQLLQFIATGAEAAPEYELSLNKMVCGVPLVNPIPRYISLSSEEKAEAEVFMTSIIKQVPKLKNTSVDGLRHSFLLREGKLWRHQHAWKLRVQPESYDPFLLDQLPWPISMVKYPWMAQLLHVEWI